MDAFSQILRMLKMNVAVYHNAKVCGNWTIREHALGATCFHAITANKCRIRIPGEFEGVLEFGDLIIFPRELKHLMQPEVVRSGSKRSRNQSSATGLLCGEVQFSHQCSQYILDSLPPVLLIRFSESKAWLWPLLELLALENQNSGSASKVLVDKLCELLFTYALRHYLAQRTGKAGLLSVYAHPQIAKTVDAIHREPKKNWTLDVMARFAGLSRTSFAEKFKTVSGWTPGYYLMWWRMQMAWSFLREGEIVEQVAEKVGYSSQSAFSHAFQKLFGVSAGEVRRGTPTKATNELRSK